MVDGVPPKLFTAAPEVSAELLLPIICRSGLSEKIKKEKKGMTDSKEIQF